MIGAGYQSGFGNEFATEAVSGALPHGQNSPQQAPLGLYAEQLSGTAFTAPRAQNRRSWLYRIRPASQHPPFTLLANTRIVSDFHAMPPTPPNQLRWDPLPLPDSSTPVDFIDGWHTMAGNGSAEAMSGCAIHVYAANRSMQRFFYSADGELLVVPQEGRLAIATELGLIELEPQEIAVIPRGVRFRVTLPDGMARGYVCENFGTAFRLPDMGPIGSNGLANAAIFSRRTRPTKISMASASCWPSSAAICGVRPSDHSPLDVVAWHGNYAPYKYDLRRFNTIGSISYDHPDPSIFLVLQAPSENPLLGAIDFAIFPPRWLAAEHTFRPPWFHRNVASEFMGLIHGVYDAKAAGFVPGGASLHNCMSGHGPDAQTFEKASHSDTSAPVEGGRHHGLHVRDAHHPQAHAVRLERRPAAKRLFRVLARLAQAFRS